MQNLRRLAIPFGQGFTPECVIFTDSQQMIGSCHSRYQTNIYNYLLYYVSWWKNRAIDVFLSNVPLWKGFIWYSNTIIAL